MIHFSIKKGDTNHVLTTKLCRDGSVIDLTGATVKFYMSLHGESVLTVDADCNVSDAENGEVEYTWIAADVDTAGLFEGEFVVTFSSGKIETFPNDQFLFIEIVEDL